MEMYLNSKGLISQDAWEKVVVSLHEEVDSMSVIKDKKEAKQILNKDFVKAVQARIPKEKFGVFFSGGIDSSLIALVCKKLNADFTCYSVGFKTGDMDIPPDLECAQRVAEELDLDFKFKLYDINQSENIIKEVVAILPKPEAVSIDYVVKIGVGAVVVGAAKMAEETVFFSGLGSEEIFAGYERHGEVEDVSRECWRGLKMMWARDLIRDCTLAKSIGISILTPFLDRQLVIDAMRVPDSLKITEEQKKIIIREVAIDLGMNPEFAMRKKQGAQYGSRSNKILDKLARKKGFKLKKEYLASLLE